MSLCLNVLALRKRLRAQRGEALGVPGGVRHAGEVSGVLVVFLEILEIGLAGGRSISTNARVEAYKAAYKKRKIE
tara:strand:- start:45 stop:269 length:225 start_codon:yes stop_codon:yes gene_type:complete